MNRRTFMISAAACGPVVGGWPWSACEAIGTASNGNTLAIVDRTLTSAASFARYAAHLQLRTFDTGDDIGALWYTTLAPLVGVAGCGPAMIGLIRASDYFVLGELLTRAGHRLVDSNGEAHEVIFAFAPHRPRGGEASAS